MCPVFVVVCVVQGEIENEKRQKIEHSEILTVVAREHGFAALGSQSFTSAKSLELMHKLETAHRAAQQEVQAKTKVTATRTTPSYISNACNCHSYNSIIYIECM